jgi:hypothetical protein
VLVKARKKAEAVLAGEVLAPALPGIRHIHAPGLAAEEALALEDANSEASFREFVGHAETTDTPTKDNNRFVFANHA